MANSMWIWSLENVRLLWMLPVPVLQTIAPSSTAHFAGVPSW